MKNIILAIIFLAAATAFAQKPIFTAAKVKSATVYFNAAELAQTASVSLPSGTSEIVVKNVANNLSESTIQIGAPATLTVLSVQFTNNYMSEYDVDENSPIVRKVRDSIKLVQNEIVRIQTEKYANTKTIELLDRNQQVSGVNAGLNVAELMKMVEYYKIKRTDLANAITSLQETENGLNAKLQNLNNKLEINTSRDEKTSSGKLILQVMNEVAGTVPLEISYLTNTASWTPFYDLRANNTTSPINMMYKAQVVQNSGVDWKKVKLTLSSGLPSQNNQAPLLRPWFLQFGNTNLGYFSSNDKKEDDSTLSEVVVTANSLKSRTAGVSVSATIVETQLNISFDIDIPYDILSNGKTHSVALKEIELPAKYKYYAAPTVDTDAFLLAEISDYSKYNLLKGEANIIFEGMYVGKTTINPNQTSDTLNLSMGRDKKISIKREKVVDKSGSRFLSSYKEQTFTYDIVIRNNKKESVQLSLKDQIPLSTNKEVTVELIESDKGKIDPESGILSWELKLSPNETKKIRISYKVRYPKGAFINNL